jgi:hypothetical protein
MHLESQVLPLIILAIIIKNKVYKLSMQFGSIVKFILINGGNQMFFFCGELLFQNITNFF